MANLKTYKRASELQLVGEQSGFKSLPLPSFKQLFSKGLSRGSIAEINGRKSSGKTSIFLYVLAQATRRGEVCAVVDFDGNFHPGSAVAAGVRLEHLVWVRCRRNAEHTMRAADLLLHAGGFGVVVLDLCEANAWVLNRIPLSYWYRFRRAVEHTPTILLVCAESIQAKSCASNQLRIKSKAFNWAGTAPFSLLRGLETNAILSKGSTAQPEALFIQTAA